ncbi:MAG: hypothetical protein DCC68_24185 [Planctomycetota bacterium]|nr:MAG: hypothetical protein DCC68_24185 [Planctomycetota bacterium]
MAKPVFNQDLRDKATEAVWAAWRLDPDIALCWPFDEVAEYAERRWRGSARRGVPRDDIEARIKDLAKGIATRNGGDSGPPLPHQIRLARALATFFASWTD